MFNLISGHEDAERVEQWVKQFNDIPAIKTSKRVEYYNIPCAFDIETTSWIDEQGRKRGTMYVWQLGVNGRVIMGRTWRDFVRVLRVLAEHFGTNDKKRLIIYVHYLAFEFQWMRKWLEWGDIFATDTRNPLYAVTLDGIEFRCSYMLSGLSLDNVGKNLTAYPVKKLGDFDYSKIRHSKTPLTPQEYAYCEHDALVVMSYIQEEVEREGNIARLPLTKTGYVRKFCRAACMYEGSHKNAVGKYKDYRELMDELRLDLPEFEQLRRAFQGGFTHANARMACKTLEQVDSWDFTSSYPYVMCVNRYPMSRGKLVAVDADSFEYYIERYCCLFDVEFEMLEPVFWEENYLSRFKCWEARNVLENNGRVVTADFVRTTITDIDYQIIKRYYKWRKIRVANFRIYTRGYLPTDFVKAIVGLYEDKTKLKGVEGMEPVYQIKKGMVNANYGMAVTNPIQELNEYNTETDKWRIHSTMEWRYDEFDLEQIPEDELPDVAELVQKYNGNKNRFLFYPWGVWITAHARYNLMTSILAFGDDYVYSDTDSIKAINGSRHYDFIEAYNQHVFDMLKRASDYHKIPLESFMPCTVKGEQKPLGVWEWETSPENGGAYERFKTLGAKRYMLEKYKDETHTEKQISLTVAGLNKKLAVPYMLEKYGQEKIFDAFTNNLVIPAGQTGRKDPVYIDKPTKGSIIDYTGQTFEYEERSSVYMEDTEYSLSMSDQYVKFLKGYRDFVK